MAQPYQLDHLPRHSGAEADPENHPAMTETPQQPKDWHMIIAEDGLLRFVPPPGSVLSEDQIAKIVAYMCRENAERILAQKITLTNQPNK